MLDALFSPGRLKVIIATALALGTIVVMLRTVRALIRAARPSGRSRDSDRPDLIHGPQELPRQSVPVEREK